MRARQLRACAALSVLTLATTASGEEPRRALVFLEWTRAPGAETCLSEEELVEDVEVTLRRRPFAPRAAADRFLRAAIARSESGIGWTARIALSTRDGESLGARDITIENESCAEASEAIVLALSLMVELPLTAAEIEARRHAEEASRWHLEGRLGPAIAVDETLTPAPAANLGLVLRPGQFWPIALDAVASLRSEMSSQQSRYWLASTMLGLSVCPLSTSWSKLRVSGCAGPEITMFTGWGGGFAKNRLGLSSTVGAWVHSDVTYELSRRLHAFVSLGVVATPQQLELTFADPEGVEQRLYRTSFVTALGAAGLAVHFF
ncbi:MAG: hypothetical protein BGO98_37325 [Myxococcales bacterium 68-20]|nr:MAG: hypothetical protein BGO98_37325 [Myxococcales bacterium 68-20]